jgi:SAM-dependent methyltransferase
VTIRTGDNSGFTPTDNDVERRRWNDAYWTSIWPRREALTDNVSADLLAHLAPERGERVLDIGSGGGKLSIAVAERVGPEGQVLGADISEPLLELARDRARQAGAANVGFVLADAQRDDLPGAPYAAATSQFGVMFFDEPVVAFANIRRQVQKGGRLVFACWQSMDRNPWALGHAIGAYTPSPPAPADGKSQTGPFVLGDFERTSGILVAAGWRDPQAAPYERVVAVDRSAIFDDGQLVFNGVAEDDLPPARDAMERHLAQFTRADGLLHFSVSYFVVSAH